MSVATCDSPACELLRPGPRTLACFAVAVLAHVALLAHLTDSARDRRVAPRPPVTVTLIAPPAAPSGPEPQAAAAAAPRKEPPAPAAKATQQPSRPRTAEPRTTPPATPARPALSPPKAAAEAPPAATSPAPRSSQAEPEVGAAPAAPETQAAPPASAPAQPGSAGPAASVAKPSAASEPLVPPRFDAAYLENPAPEYPRLARRLGEEGTVLLDVYVSPSGTPERVQLHTSSGSPRLDEAARETVKRWKFVPARQGERPVAAWIVVPIRFVLKG